jgi:hypothetical protein
MTYMELFPESAYPAYYTHAMTCGPLHPSEAAQGMFESAADALLSELPAVRRRAIRVIRW